MQELQKDVQLKPCPFCGNEQVQIRYGSYGREHTSNLYEPMKQGCVRCVKCGASTIVCRYAKNAVEKWNSRSFESTEIPDGTEAVLICAVRYALGRQSYMPGLVIDYITPRLPMLSDGTLRCFDQDIAEQKYYGGYGDPDVDEPRWMAFHRTVREELKRRGREVYTSWREQ